MAFIAHKPPAPPLVRALVSPLPRLDRLQPARVSVHPRPPPPPPWSCAMADWWFAPTLTSINKHPLTTTTTTRRRQLSSSSQASSTATTNTNANATLPSSSNPTPSTSTPSPASVVLSWGSYNSVSARRRAQNHQVLPSPSPIAALNNNPALSQTLVGGRRGGSSSSSSRGRSSSSSNGGNRW